MDAEEDFHDPDGRTSRGLVPYCDERCNAKDEPATAEDYKLAYTHWRYHAMWLGCSHGH